jgi:DDE family transposase
VPAKVTRDGLVARLTQWWEAVRERCAHLTPLVLHGEDGPEHHRRRTHCRQRLVECVQPYPVRVRLAYSPPSHSTDPPIERCWGLLETPWHGALLDSLDTVLRLAATMTWKGTPPLVALVTTT